MGYDLAFYPVFQGRYDGAPVRIVFRVSREYKQDIQRQPQPEAADLDIPFLQDIEQGNLDARLKVRQLVDYKNTPVAPGNDAEVNGPFIRVAQPQVSSLDRVYIPDEVRHRHIRRGQLLSISFVPVNPFQRSIFLLFGNQ